eukprot:gene25103-biopygen4475
MRRNAAPQAPPARGMEEMKKCSAGGAVGTFYVPWIPFTSRRHNVAPAECRDCLLQALRAAYHHARRRQSPSYQNPRSRGGRRRQRPLYPCQLGHGTFAGAAAVAWRRRRWIFWEEATKVRWQKKTATQKLERCMQHLPATCALHKTKGSPLNALGRDQRRL